MVARDWGESSSSQNQRCDDFLFARNGRLGDRVGGGERRGNARVPPPPAALRYVNGGLGGGTEVMLLWQVPPQEDDPRPKVPREHESRPNLCPRSGSRLPGGA